MITFDEFLEHLSDPSLVYKDRFTEKIEILRLKNDMGWTIAHAQSMRGWTTKDKSILKWSTNKGYTVAHCQAFHGEIFTSKSINRLSAKNWLPASAKSTGGSNLTVEQLGSLVTKGYSYISKARSKK